MNAIKKMLLVPTSALLFAAAAGSAQADDYVAIDRIDDILTHASDYGFTHYEEIKVKSRGRTEVEGWLDDEWYADIEFLIDNGESLKEERKRLITGAWGMSEDDVRQALNAAQTEGMAEFEEIEIDKTGLIDIEGRDENGRELEISLRQGSLQVSDVERD